MLLKTTYNSFVYLAMIWIIVIISYVNVGDFWWRRWRNRYSRIWKHESELCRQLSETSFIKWPTTACSSLTFDKLLITVEVLQLKCQFHLGVLIASEYRCLHNLTFYCILLLLLLENLLRIHFCADRCLDRKRLNFQKLWCWYICLKYSMNCCNK